MWLPGPHLQILLHRRALHAPLELENLCSRRCGTIRQLGNMKTPQRAPHRISGSRECNALSVTTCTHNM